MPADPLVIATTALRWYSDGNDDGGALATQTLKELGVMPPPVPTNGIISIDAGKTVDFGTVTRGISGRVKYVKNGTGPDPIIKFRGGAQSAPFSIARGSSLEIANFRFDIGHECYMFFSRGAVRAKSCNVVTSGGLIGLRSADGDNILEDCSTPLVGYYGAFTSAEAPAKNPDGTYKAGPDGGTIVIPSKSLQLINCNLTGRDQDKANPVAPFTHQHVVRCHALTYLKIQGGKLVGPQVAAGHCAALRPHDVKKVEITGLVVEGKSYFGPLAGGDGGIQHPAGSPERITAEKAQLGELYISKSFFTGNFKLASGVKNGRIADSSINTTMFHTAIDAEGDYIGRGNPRADLVRMSLMVKDLTKPVSVTPGHPEIRYGPGVVFQGKLLPADPAVAA